MTSASRRRVRCHVSGVVQGVYYRAETQHEASRLGLSGWVRNLPDGRVEFVAEGGEAEVQALIRWAHEGPPMARVDDLEVLEEGLTGTMTAFEVRPTPWGE